MGKKTVEIWFSRFTPNLINECGYLTEMGEKGVYCSAQNSKRVRNAIYKTLLTEVRLGPSLRLQFAINSIKICIIDWKYASR